MVHHKTVLTIIPLILQTIIIAHILSNGGEAVIYCRFSDEKYMDIILVPTKLHLCSKFQLWTFCNFQAIMCKKIVLSLSATKLDWPRASATTEEHYKSRHNKDIITHM